MERTILPRNIIVVTLIDEQTDSFGRRLAVFKSVIRGRRTRRVGKTSVGTAIGRAHSLQQPQRQQEVLKARKMSLSMTTTLRLAWFVCGDEPVVGIRKTKECETNGLLGRTETGRLSICKKKL